MSLFPEYENKWQQEWKDMPEFISNNKKPYQQVIVSFRNFDDAKAFADKLGVKITPNTKSMWYPYRSVDNDQYYTSDKWGEDEE